MIPTASELFGLKHFGTIYNFITLGDSLGSCLFSGWLAGSLYDREAERQRQWTTSVNLPPRRIWDILISQGHGAQCKGAHCFRLTFLIMAGVCIVGVISSIVLSYRIKPVYNTLYEAREASNSKSRDGQAGVQMFITQVIIGVLLVVGFKQEMTEKVWKQHWLWKKYVRDVDLSDDEGGDA